MHARLTSLASLNLAASLLLAGCQGSGPTSPTSASNDHTPTFGDPRVAGTGEYLAALWDCEIDPAALTATLAPRHRVGQGPQAKSYDLDIENFLGANDLKIRRVRRDGNGDLVVTVSHAHPFPAPDFTAPISSRNRADLGYTGRLLVLTDVDPGDLGDNTWFGNVSLNPELLENADGYMQPGDLLANSGFNVNTFPYKLLVNEAEDNRVNVSNAGLMTGTYDSANGGWQIANAGLGNTGWTGYDYLHGGQSTTIDLVLSESQLDAGPVSLPLAVLIKYTDPRGVTGRTRRFPVTPADPIAFAYRLPFAALDASVIAVDPVGTVEASGGPAVPITLSVRDWDTAAAEAPQADLSLETDVALIQPNASGIPVIEFDAPDLFAAPITVPSVGPTSGHPFDELQFSGVFSNVLQTALPDTYTALLRATDPEAGDLNAPDYHFGVDPNTLAADPNRAIRPITYQPVDYEVVMSIAAPEIQSVSPIGLIGGPCDEINFTATIINSPTSWSWDFGGGATPNASILESPTVTLSGAGTYNGTLVASNAGGSSAPFPFSFTVGTGTTPTWPTHSVGSISAISFEYDYSAIVSHQGRIAVAYNSGNGGPAATCCDAYFAISSNANPTTQSDWTVSSILSAGFQGQNLDMISYNDQLVVSWRDSTAGAVRVAFSQVAIPNGEGDWLTYTLESGFTGLDTELNEVNGLLGISYGGGSPSSLRFARATSATPLNAGSWVWHTVDTTASCGNDTGWVSYQGTPVIVHRNYNTGDILIARATTPTPNTTADWAKSAVELAATSNVAPGNYNGTSLGVAVTGDRLAVVYNDTTIKTMTFNLATSAAPNGPTDWTRYNLDPVGDMGGDLDIMNLNGRLVMFYAFDENPTVGIDNVGLKATRALSCTPTSVADWAFSTVLTGSGGQGWMPGVGIHDNRIVATHRGFTPSFATTQQVTIGSGLW